jgi:hypothetical protein
LPDHSAAHAGKVALGFVPTAMQWVSAEHDTPVKDGSPGGAGRIDQLVPFQRSAVPNPTAKQEVDEEHDTLSRLPPYLSGRIDQLLPFHRSTRTPSEELPTATQTF